MHRTVDFTSLVDSSDNDCLAASSHPSHATSRSYFLRHYPAPLADSLYTSQLLFSDRSSPILRHPSPLDQSIPGPSLPYAHVRDPICFVFVFHPCHMPVPRSLSPSVYFFPRFLSPCSRARTLYRSMCMSSVLLNLVEFYHLFVTFLALQDVAGVQHDSHSQLMQACSLDWSHGNCFKVSHKLVVQSYIVISRNDVMCRSSTGNMFLVSLLTLYLTRNIVQL